jgi:uncharacterized repeat protein (TIGR01451 family)
MNHKKKILRAKWLVGFVMGLLLIAAALPLGVLAAPAAAYNAPNAGTVTPSSDQASCGGCQASASAGNMGSDMLDTGPSLTYICNDVPLDEATYQKYLKRLDSGTLDASDASPDVPGAYDARNDGIVTPSKDQASCGGCWAFACAGAMESHLLKAGLSHDPSLNLSEQQQISCNMDMNGCCGGNPTSLEFWEDRGPVYETCFPWGDGGTSCPTNSNVACSNGDNCPQLPYRVTNFYTVDSDQFRESLYADGPSYFRFDEYSDFQNWYFGAPAGSVYVNQDGTSKVGGHAVLIIGWDDGKNAYLLKNSWGENTGPQTDGTFWMAYDGHANGLGFGMANFNVESLPVDMSIAKSDNPDPVIAGEQLTYDITVTNVGPDTVTNVVVTDVLPSAVTYLVSTASCVEGPVGTLTCTLPAMASGASWSFQIVVKVKEDAALPIGTSVLANTASVTSDGTDTNPADNSATTYTIVNEKADLRLYKECKPDEPLLAGQTATCSIVVENLGPSTARNVRVIDVHLSNGIFTIGSVTTTAGTCAKSNGTVTCDLGDVAPGDRITITVPITADTPQDVNDRATVYSDTPDPNPGNNYWEDGVTFIGSADLELHKTAAPDPVIAGTNLTYSFLVINNGPSKARNVVIQDVMPAGITILSVSAPGGTCNAGIPGNAGVPTTCTFDSMAKGDVKTMEVVVKVDPSFLGTLGNNARTFSDTYDPNNDNNLATTFTTVNANADLSVQKTEYPDPVLAGTVLTFDVKVTNNGPSTAVDVALADVLPAWVTFQGYQVSNGAGTCSLLPGSTTNLSGDLNDLLPGQFVRVVFTVLVNPSTPHGTHLTNTATVSAATHDPNQANNTATTDTTVNAQADLKISKDASVLSTNAGPRVTYTLTVLNNGPSDAQNVTVVDTLPLDPKKVIYIMDSGNGNCTYSKTPSPHHVTWNVGTLKAGESRTVQIVVDIRGSVGVITNYATVTSATFDPILANNTVRKDVRIKGGPGKK